MNNKIALLIAVLSIATFVYAISAGDAVNFVTEENHFLYPTEDFEQPIVQITHNEEGYWVIPVLSVDNPVTFFAVKVDTKELESSRVKNRELFKTAYILREFLESKQAVSADPQLDWIITSSYSRVFSNLGRFLSDEIFELNTIDTEMNDPTVSNDISNLNRMLVSMSLKCTSVSTEMDGALLFESSFTSSPNTNQTENLREEYSDVFSILYDLEEEALSYRTEIDKLKQSISTSDLDASTKTHLINLADPPENFNNIGNYVLDAVQLEEAIDAVYSNAQADIDSFLDEYENRLERSDAYEVLYGENDFLSNKTDGSFTILKSARDYILNKDNRQYWKNQSKVNSLESNWNRAERYFNERNYVDTVEYANKAINDVVDVYKGGLIDTEPEPLLSTELIIQIVILLIALLVLIYIWNNREKIVRIIKPEEIEKEVEIDAFSREI